ncbi:MAG: ribosome silencing factor [Alphaproteobacteria bacterium]|nr:ribosome silencing factor [Alphaproteobacteria bacterium]
MGSLRPHPLLETSALATKATKTPASPRPASKPRAAAKTTSAGKSASAAKAPSVGKIATAAKKASATKASSAAKTASAAKSASAAKTRVAPQKDPADAAVTKLVKGIHASLDDAKAEDIVMLDLRGKTSIADVMIIATGRSTTHVGAIADRIFKDCKAQGLVPRIEGVPQCDWVLVDAGDVIVHLFRPDVREFYNLEKMWGGPRPGEGLESSRAH